jgi:uncharacterized SAM-binding protein YcdF (DUF218 family)
MNPKLKKCLRPAVRVVCVLLLLVVMGWVFAPALLVVDSGTQAADAVVVLGGEPWTRPTRGAEVFKESHSTLVIVTGNGDCQDVRRQMEAKGVPNSMIEIEGESRSTQENAVFSVKLLRAHQATNVVLVTSWYHSRRAMSCFRQAAPEIHFSSRPTPCPPAGVRHPDSYIVKRVFQEYAKIAYYRVIYGVASW